MNRIYGYFLMLLFAVFAFSETAFAQPVSQSSMAKFVTAVPNPNTCNVADKNQALIFVKAVGLYKCVGSIYVAAEAAGGSGNVQSIAESSNYPSLENLANAIGSTAKVNLVLNQDLPCTSAVTLTPNILISSVKGKIIKSSNCKVFFAGKGLHNADSSTVLFSGFLPGDIKFTGTETPEKINTAIFDNTDAAQRINLADQAFIGKAVEISASAGNLGEQVIISEKHALKLQAGSFTNTVSKPNVGFGGFDASIRIYSDASISGAGIGRTILYESSANLGFIQLIYASNMADHLSNDVNLAVNNNITISDLTIAGASNQIQNQNDSAIQLGNTHNGRIERIHFDKVRGFAAYVGIDSGTNNHYAKNIFIIDCIFENVGTQNVGSLSSDGLTISRNQFINDGTITQLTGYNPEYSNFIDLEPNNASSRMENVRISDNIFRAIGTNRPFYAITIQSGLIDRVKNVTVENNQIIGGEISPGAVIPGGFSTGFTGYNLENVTLRNNSFIGIGNRAVDVHNSSQVHILGNTFTNTGTHPSTGNFAGAGHDGVAAIYLSGVNDSYIKGNLFPKRQDYPQPFGNNDFLNLSNTESQTIEERNFTQTVSVTTSNGVATVTTSQVNAPGKGIYKYWEGRRVYLSGTGVTTGYYKIKPGSVVFSSQGLTTAVLTADLPNSLTTDVDAGNSANALLTTKFGNNHYIDNVNADYVIPSDSASTYSDAATPTPIYFYTVFADGELSAANYPFTDNAGVITGTTIGNLNVGKSTRFVIKSIQAYSRSPLPSGCSSNAYVELFGSKSEYVNNFLRLNLTSAAQQITENKKMTSDRSDLFVRIVGAAGCSVFPANYNIAVGYQMGGGLSYAPTEPVNFGFATKSTSSIILKWTAGVDDRAVTGHEIQYTSTTDLGGVPDFFNKPIIVTGAENTTNITGLTAATTYYFHIRAVDADQNASDWSNVISITTN